MKPSALLPGGWGYPRNLAVALHGLVAAVAILALVDPGGFGDRPGGA